MAANYPAGASFDPRAPFNASPLPAMCDSCTWDGSEEDTEELTVADQGVGHAPEPCGCCPQCGALCYVYDPRDVL